MRRWVIKILKIILVVTVFVGFFQYGKPFPEKLILQPKQYNVPEDSVRFFADYTYINSAQQRVVEQQIWDEIFRAINAAERYVLLDMFLYNDYQGTKPEKTRSLSFELTNVLLKNLEKKQHLAVTLITDPINTVYGGATSTQFEQLKKAGVLIIETDLTQLFDSNRIWSAFWRPFVSPWDNSVTGGWLPHPFQENGEKVTLRSWLSLLNFKANHRKIVVSDYVVERKGMPSVQKMRTILTSSNPHDGSSAHGNVALAINDGVWRDAINAEQRIAELSDLGIPSISATDVVDEEGPLAVTLLREEQIRKKTLHILQNAKKGDVIDIVMFYLSDRKIVRALADAANRGVSLRIILDPNKDAFGFEKNGIPNRPVAKELVTRSNGDILIRWCDTHGEQCHAKLMMGKTASSSFILLGSANFTDRNIGGFNLEESAFVESLQPFSAWNDAQRYFERIWSNENGTFTADYSKYEDHSLWKSSFYRIMERTGLSSF